MTPLPDRETPRLDPERPKRIQRRRTKGWRMSEGAVYVGRPTEWGNPFTGPDAVEHYRLWMAGEFVPDHPLRQRRDDEGDPRTTPRAIAALFLSGRDLVCWCPLDQPCHADVLLELANA